MACDNRPPGKAGTGRVRVESLSILAWYYSSFFCLFPFCAVEHRVMTMRYAVVSFISAATQSQSLSDLFGSKRLEFPRHASTAWRIHTTLLCHYTFIVKYMSTEMDKLYRFRRIKAIELHNLPSESDERSYCLNIFAGKHLKTREFKMEKAPGTTPTPKWTIDIDLSNIKGCETFEIDVYCCQDKRDRSLGFYQTPIREIVIGKNNKQVFVSRYFFKNLPGTCRRDHTIGW
ncbi:hypothetical protein EV421DRAFT_796899 [Armillaria borealis]|uniref:Uncharacterized protein n=1 Tax=Armillaria borealis TaxID=47425 RepID=A0AA39MML3_9AGAR|nr:hypothetical protein EV421DRAFT_796899 [Armillaria borealis]